MKILEKIDWNVLNKYIENNLIVANKHFEYDIWILNYSPKTQSNAFWDEYTLSCRGLIIDINGNILARPFQKFKNLEEYNQSEIDLSQDFEIFEKRDGSLIILFYYFEQKKWIIASRGSFISEQSIEAEKMFHLKSKAMSDPKYLELPYLDKNYTYLWEIHYKDNRIVIDYGNLWDIFLLAKIETKTGVEIPYDEMKNRYSKYFSVVEKFNIKIKNLYDLKKLEEDNKEGFVIKFSNGMRIKVKFDEYVRLHGILTNVSNLTVWEHLMNNYDFDLLLDRVPDEFFNWLKKTAKGLQCQYNNIERLAIKEFLRIYHVNEIIDRKRFAAEAIKTEYRSILFKLYDKKPYDDIIWRMIRPTFSKPFKNGYEQP